MQFHALTFISILLFGTANLFGQNPDSYKLSSDTLVNRLTGTKRIYTAHRIENKPKIDGKLKDECWQIGEWSGGFVQQVPAQGKKPSQETEIKILYDNNNIYVGFRCYDKGPGSIRPILGRRDQFSGDIAGIAFDSYNDKQTAYEFNVAASGQKIDLVHVGAYNFDLNWDAVWDGKAEVYDSIWTTELQIPFSQLRFSPGDKQVWGIHIWRWIDRLEEESQWKLIPIDAPAMVYLFGELHGIEGVKPKTNFEFLPFLNSKYSPDSDMENKLKFGFGLNGKVGLNSGLTLDYAVNPDFGQVEADPSVLNLTTYEVFNEEKRPFFLEGNTILDFSVEEDMLFYSRRIGHAPSYYPSLGENQTISIADNTPILSALKLTGKNKKGLSIGVIQSITAKENATIFDNTSKTKIAVEPFTSNIVGRLKQDINEGNTVIGGMITSTIRDINDDHLNFLSTKATSAGIDFQHNWLKRKYFIDFKGFYSDIRGYAKAISALQLSPVHYYQRTDADHLDYDPNRTNISGHGGILTGGKRSGKFRAVGTLNWRTPGVDLNDMGYMRQADLLEEMINITYKVNIPKSFIRSYFIEFEQEKSWSFGGENTMDRLKLHPYFQFKNLWNVHLNYKRYFNINDTRELRGGPALYKDSYNDYEVFIQSNQVKSLFVGFGPRFKFYSDNISKTNYFTLFLRLRLGDRFSVTSRTVIDNSIDNNKYVARPKDTSGNTGYIVGKIDRNTISSTLRFEYFISPEISIQYYGNPYASIGRFENLREVADAANTSLTKRYNSLTTSVNANNTYSLLKNGIVRYTINKPDFNFQQFRSNFVGRWEFRPGSTLYLVWTNTRSAYAPADNSSIYKSLGNIWNINSQNVFMVKFSYWFSL